MNTTGLIGLGATQRAEQVCTRPLPSGNSYRQPATRKSPYPDDRPYGLTINMVAMTTVVAIVYKRA